METYIDTKEDFNQIHVKATHPKATTTYYEYDLSNKYILHYLTIIFNVIYIIMCII